MTPGSRLHLRNEAIRAAYVAGEKTSEIGRAHSLTRWSVLRILHSFGIKPHGKRGPPARKCHASRARPGVSARLRRKGDEVEVGLPDICWTVVLRNGTLCPDEHAYLADAIACFSAPCGPATQRKPYGTAAARAKRDDAVLSALESGAAPRDVQQRFSLSESAVNRSAARARARAAKTSPRSTHTKGSTNADPC